MDKPAGPVRSLTFFLQTAQAINASPGDELAVQEIARVNRLSLETARHILGSIVQTRAVIENYMGRDTKDEASIQALFGRLFIDFAISPVEAECLNHYQLTALLTLLQRWKNWEPDEKQGVLTQAANIRDSLSRKFTGEDSDRVFLKALDRFPLPTVSNCLDSDTVSTAPCPKVPPVSRPELPPPDESKPTCRNPPVWPDHKLKHPSVQAIQCYRLSILKGDTQKTIAKTVYKDANKQGQVSRDLACVRRWITAGNVLPDLDEAKPKLIPVDPTKLDRGARSDRGRKR